MLRHQQAGPGLFKATFYEDFPFLFLLLEGVQGKGRRESGDGTLVAEAKETDTTTWGLYQKELQSCVYLQVRTGFLHMCEGGQC